MTLDNDNHWFMYFDNVEMSNMNEMCWCRFHINFTNTRANQFVDANRNNDNPLHDWIWIVCVVCVNGDK